MLIVRFEISQSTEAETFRTFANILKGSFRVKPLRPIWKIVRFCSHLFENDTMHTLIGITKVILS